jgi:hypothetical protein
VPFSLAERRFFVSGRGRGFLRKLFSDVCEVFGKRGQGSLHGVDVALDASLKGNQRTHALVDGYSVSLQGLHLAHRGRGESGSLTVPFRYVVLETRCITQGLFSTSLLALAAGLCFFDFSTSALRCIPQASLPRFLGISGEPPLHRGEVGASFGLARGFCNRC